MLAPNEETSMNYQLIYERLMDSCKSRDWKANRYRWGTVEPKCYVEVHHIQPRSLGGTDHQDNLVVLTAREHYIAHRLLHKIHKSRKTAAALAAMSLSKNSERVYNARQFSVLRQAASEARKGKLTPEQLAKHREVHLGAKRPLETGRRISEAKKGTPSWSKGKKLTEEQKKNMKGKKKTLRYVQCPHCGKTGAAHGMTRYHFDNCKFK